MSKKDAIYFFKEIIDNENLRREIQEVSAKYEDKDTSFSDIKSLIDTEIIPLAEKYGFKFSAIEILEVENDLFGQSKSALDLDDLEEVAGGISKKGIAFAMSALICLPLFSSAASAFDAPSHSYTTEAGFDVLLNSKADDQGYVNFFTESMKESLEASCNKPDHDENDLAFLYHFYNPETGRNFAGRRTSALTKLEEHYNNALNLYRSNHLDSAREELARAIHFLEDLNTPVHTHNDSVISTGKDALTHNLFERVCNEELDNVTAESIKLTEEDYKNNLNVSLHDFGHNCAVESNKLYSQLKEHVSPTSVTKVARQAIANASKAVALLLNRFYNEVGNNKNQQANPIILNEGETKTQIDKIGKNLTCKTEVTYGKESVLDSQDGSTSKKTRTATIKQIIVDNKGLTKAYNVFSTQFVYDGNSVSVLDEAKNISSDTSSCDEKNIHINDVGSAKVSNDGNCNVSKTVKISQKRGFFNRMFHLNYGWRNVSSSNMQISCTPDGTLDFVF